MSLRTTDFLVIGGGVIGLNIAKRLKQEFTDSSVLLIEKEDGCGQHASGRNSGVVHAGFYYSPESLKAKLTRDGNRRLTAYCVERNIPLNRCGKLVVARNATDLPSLDELIKRGKANGIELTELTEAEAKTMEPRVKTYQRALYSPTTSTVDPQLVMKAMVKDVLDGGAEIHLGSPFLRKSGKKVITPNMVYEAGYVVNAGGLYADRIARQFGFSEHYRILPFKGLYLYSSEPPGTLRTNIYPVPDLRNPFLGVHFTITNDGRAKIGPTAIPAFWREQYSGLNRFSIAEFMEIATRGVSLLGSAGFEFRRLAIEEIRKYSKRRMVALAGELVEGIRPEHYTRWGKPGIRAQLLDIRKRRLEMDFIVEGDDRSMHVLNAVSPAFTCAIPFSEYVCDRIHQQLHR